MTQSTGFMSTRSTGLMSRTCDTVNRFYAFIAAKDNVELSNNSFFADKIIVKKVDDLFVLYKEYQ